MMMRIVAMRNARWVIAASFLLKRTRAETVGDCMAGIAGTIRHAFRSGDFWRRILQTVVGSWLRPSASRYRSESNTCAPRSGYLPAVVALAPLRPEKASETRCRERLFKMLFISWRARAGLWSSGGTMRSYEPEEKTKPSKSVGQQAN